MRLLFLGAGATGGYFGGRLANAGADVTFLVRPKRRDQLARDGLRIESPLGNVGISVNAITQDEIVAPYDVVVVSAKAYDLASAIDAIRPAVGDNSLVLPLLNGLKHLDDLDAAFGAARVLGGTCHISATLTGEGTIRQFTPLASLTQGPRRDSQRQASAELHAVLSNGGFDAHRSDDIIAAMWEKWFFLAALASSTCLMRAPVADIARGDNGPAFMTSVLNECTAVATASGYPPPDQSLNFARQHLCDPASPLSASMLRDIERGAEIEADQIVGDLIRRGRKNGIATPLLDIAFLHLQAYRNKRAAAAKT